jgi:O-methyltransferase
MIPKNTYMRNLMLAKSYSGVPGAVIECGVYKGGMIAGIAELLGDTREYWLFDSFEGLPEAKPVDGERARTWQKNEQHPGYFDNCAADSSFAEAALLKSGVNNYHICEDWFENSLPNLDEGLEISILRLDGDWYESTKTCLENMYPRVVPGGIVIIDDYYSWEGCRKAVHDYLSENHLSCAIQRFDNDVYFILKP